MSETLTIKKPSSANNPSTGSQTVTVASKLSFGFILQLHDRVEGLEETVHGQTRKFAQYFPKKGAVTYTLNGNSYRERMGDNGQHIENGFAITTGIPKDFWEQWLEQHKESDLVTNGMIFAHTDLASVKSEAQEKENIAQGMSGNNRIDPENLPKMGKHKLETADRKSY